MLQPCIILPLYNPVVEVFFLQQIVVHCKKFLTHFGVLTQGIVLPGQIDIAEQVKPILVFIQLFADPAMALAIFNITLYGCNTKIGIAKKQAVVFTCGNFGI